MFFRMETAFKLSSYGQKPSTCGPLQAGKRHKTEGEAVGGVTANYGNYAKGSNDAPSAVASGTVAGTAVSADSTTSPAAVSNTGGMSPCGTRGQNGNAREWTESALTTPNDSPPESRTFRGGSWDNDASYLRSLYQGSRAPDLELPNVGFCVASIPEPSAVLPVFGGLVAWPLQRRLKFSL